MPTRRLQPPLDSLHLLASLYNRKPRRHPATGQHEAMTELKAIVNDCAGLPASEPIPPEAVTRMNGLSAQAPVQLTIEEQEADDDGPRETEAGMAWKDYRGYVLQLLWHWLQHSARDRLKRCPPCGQAFVDSSKNHCRLYCSQACHDREWSYAKRKTAGHLLKRPSTRIVKNPPRIRTARRLN